MNVLITAGPTREYLDQVRYLSNASTGRMGYALAAAPKAAGHEVTVIHGPTAHAPPEVDKAIAVTGALEMCEAVAGEFAACDVFISCAAVSDYRPAERHSGKIKRESAETLTVELVQNPDIVREMASRRRPGQVVIGFALEAETPEAHAREKLRRKGLDAIVLNHPSAIGADETEITVFQAALDVGDKFCGSKALAAERIVALAESLVAGRS